MNLSGQRIEYWSFVFMTMTNVSSGIQSGSGSRDPGYAIPNISGWSWRRWGESVR